MVNFAWFGLILSILNIQTSVFGKISIYKQYLSISTGFYTIVLNFKEIEGIEIEKESQIRYCLQLKSKKRIYIAPWSYYGSDEIVPLIKEKIEMYKSE
jgi:hypothetical protein